MREPPLGQRQLEVEVTQPKARHTYFEFEHETHHTRVCIGNAAEEEKAIQFASTC